MRSLARMLLPLLGVVLWGCSGGPGRVESVRSLDLHARDGVKLAATLYLPDKPHPPGVILVHREGLNRHSWDGLAERLRSAGYLALSFDLRGHGNSRGQAEQRLDYRRFSAEDWDRVLSDLDVLRETLIKEGASPENLAIVGEGRGAEWAARYAARDLSMQAVALISPDPGESLRQAARQLRGRPLLLLAAEGDTASATAVSALKAESQSFCELHMYPGAAHGTDLFAASQNALNQVVVWLDPIIGPRASEQAHGRDGEHRQPAQ